MEKKDFANFAIHLASLSGEVLKKYWGKLIHVEEKSHSSDLVTNADKESEEVMLSELKKELPSHAILAEESGAIGKQDAEYLWIIDPLDGTTNYSHQYPFFAVSIGLIHRNKPIVGVVYNPIYDELFVGVQGEGASLNNHPIKVSTVNELRCSLIATGFPYNRNEIPDNNYAEFNKLTSMTQGVRRQGSAALDLANVACGRLDGFWEKGLQPWDSAAGIVLVSEAGGKVTNYKGQPFEVYSNEILTSNGGIHDALVKELS